MHTPENTGAGDSEIARLLRDEVIARIPLLLKYNSAAGLRLAVPDTDIQIIAGPQAWIASQILDTATNGCAQREDESNSSGTAPASQAQAAPIDVRAKLYLAAIDCPHSIEADQVILFRDPNKDGNALRQMADRVKAAFDKIAAPAVIDQPTAAEIRALQTIAEFPVTDPGNMDAWNMQAIAIRALKEAAPAEVPSQAAIDVLAERRRQVEHEGWTSEHDDKYSNCELARAAATYALCSHIEQLKLCGEQVWPWHPDWWKRTTYRRDLTKAAALLLAEIERVDRSQSRTQGESGGANA